VSYEATGTVYRIAPVQHVSERFSKRDFVLKITERGGNGQTYEQLVQFQATNRNVDNQLLKVGQLIRVSFNLRGREWTPPNGGEIRYFNTLQVWAIESAISGGSEQVQAATTTAAQPQPQTVPPVGQDDEIPF